MSSTRPPGVRTSTLKTPESSLQVNPGSPQSLPASHVLRREASSRPAVRSNLVPSDSASEDMDLEKQGEIMAEKIEDIVDALGGQNSRFTIDPAGELTHDVTTVDVVTVPCPGGDSLKTWNRDGLLGRYVGAPSMRDAEVNESERPSTSWVRQGIRREADKARILLYDHQDIVRGTTLGKLADDFLSALQDLRDGEEQQRPLLFLGHSIGGLVVKMALVKASRDSRYQNILRECYGVAFFGTPHQGSGYFAMESLSHSIQRILQLVSPLPATLLAELRVGNSLLSHIDEDFKDIASDMRIWTFYETIDSRLSGKGTGASGGDVYFTAPLTSIKSAILGMRQERIFPLQSDHANVASFGRHNVPTLRLFLRQLATQVEQADASSQDPQSWISLDLEQKVNVEVHGFFDDLVGGGAAVRAWSTRLPLRDFLKKGPYECLDERLHDVDGTPEEGQFLRTRGRTSLAEIDSRQVRTQSVSPPPLQHPLTVKDALGIDSKINPVPPASASVPPSSPVLRPFDSVRAGHGAATPQTAPVGPRTPPSFQASPPSRFTSPVQHASPILDAEFEQDLAVNRLSLPLRGARTSGSLSRSASLDSEGVSRIEYRDFPPFSPRSKSAVEEALSADEDDLEASPQLSEAVFGARSSRVRNRRASEAAGAHAACIFSSPETKARKFVWIHTPFNNPTWVKNILQTLQTSCGKNLSHLHGPDFWATRHTRGRHSQHYAYYAKPACYFTAPRTLSPARSAAASPSMSPVSGDDGIYTCLFFPYLHFDTYKRLLRRRRLILQRIQQGRSRPMPENVYKSQSLELQMIWEFLGSDPPINCRRTLDQFGYPSLRDTRSRDDDQMLYKLTKERGFLHGFSDGLKSQWSSSRDGSSRNGSTGNNGKWKDRLTWLQQNVEGNEMSEEDVLNGNVLMVDQLWLWTINTDTVLTFFPRREGDPIEGPLYQQADLRDSIFNEVNVDLTRQCENALDLAALSVLHSVTVLLDRSSHPDLEVFRIFEEAISVLTERLTYSLKEFRAEGVRDKSVDFKPIENRLRNIRARHKEEGRRAEQENRDNTSALLELRDIEDELVTLIHLFERQSKVINSMHAIYTRPELRDHTVNGRVFLNEALKKVNEYVQQTDEMIRRVRDTRDDYDKLLQMVQRQAQVDEVRLSRLNADVASAQSRSVMIFTVFTVIFLPLTFFTGLFGMNTQEWGGENNLSLKTIGAISIPASVFLIVGSLVVAWSTNVRRLFNWILRLCRRARRRIFFMLWRPTLRLLSAFLGMARRRKAAPEDEGNAPNNMMKKQESSDFWERHRLERDSGYRIPEVNRKGARMKSGNKSRKEAKPRTG